MDIPDSSAQSRALRAKSPHSPGTPAAAPPPQGASAGGMRADGPPPHTLGTTLRLARRRGGLTLVELSSRAGCDKSYLSRIENDQVRGAPSVDMLARIEAALSLQPGHLAAIAHWQFAPAPLKREQEALAQRARAAEELARALRDAAGPAQSGPTHAGIDALYKSGALQRLIARITPDAGGVVPLALPVEVPIINRVAAGYPREFSDMGYPARVADGYVRCPDLCDPDAFAARVVGDSMEPAYREGDIVVFSPSRTVTSGADCFARLEPDHETTFKRVYFERGPAGEELIRLQPLNPAYSARVLPREQVAGLYVAVSFQREV